MKIITGGSGFIGSAICWKLNLLGFKDIILVDTDIDGTKKNNIDKLYYTDFIERNEFLKLIADNSLKDTDTLYHMGACSSTTEQDMDFLKRNNFEYSQILAHWCIINNIRFIYASSGATYGDGSLGFSDSYDILPHLKPLNKYGLSKQMFDLWLLENCLFSKVVGLKYFNVFGPNENHKGDMRSMVNKAFKQIQMTGKLKLFKSYKTEYKDGEQKRDFIYIKDAVDMTVFFDTSNAVGSKVTGLFNIGSGRASTWIEMAEALFKAMGKEPSIEFIDMPDNIKNQYQYYTKAEMNKLYNAGYDKPVMSLDESVKDYVVNYLMKDKYLDSRC